MNSARIKALGREGENGAVDFLKAFFPNVERRRLKGTRDEGDLCGIPGVCLEVKNEKGFNLSGWLRELEEEIAHSGAWTGAVIHKKRGTRTAGDWYVTLPLWRYAELLIRAIGGK